MSRPARYQSNTWVQRLIPPCKVATDAKALKLDAFVEQDVGVAQALPFAAVILRDLSADGHARIDVEAGQNGIQDVAADVVEIDVDTLRRRLGKCRSNRARLVVDAVIEAEVGTDMLAFCWTAGDADDPAAIDARNLPYRAADGAGRCRHDHGFARLDVGNIDEPNKSGCPGLTHYAEAKGESTSHLPAHVGVDRQKMCAGENLAVGRPRQRRLDEPEATGIRHAFGHACVDDLAMCCHEVAPCRSTDDATDRWPRKAMR